MTIGIIDIGIGNLRSIQNMYERIGVTSDFIRQPEELSRFGKLLLPGMGHFDNCMVALNASGLRPELERLVFTEKRPVLGICVGLQMMMESSEEGVEPGMGWFKGHTVGFDRSRLGDGRKVPNMGWLDVKVRAGMPFADVFDEPRFYFAHSFHVRPEQEECTWITAEYGYPFAAALQRDNIYGVQFHPEKSHRFGMQLLKAFAEQAS